MNKVVQIWRQQVSHPIPHKAIGLSHSYEMTQRIFSSIHWTCLSLDYNKQSPLFTDVSSLNCRRRTYSFHAARNASGVRRVLPPRSPRCRSDCRHHSSLSKLRKGGLVWLGVRRAKEEEEEEVVKELQRIRHFAAKNRIKIRLILHKILQLFSTLVKVLE